MVASLRGQTLFLDVGTQQRIRNRGNLPSRLQPLMTSGNARLNLPARDEIRTNRWLQLQQNIWIGAGGVTRQLGGRFDFWVSLWDSEGRRKVTYDKHRQIPTYVVVNRQGTIAASADELGDVHVWDARTGETLAEFRSENSEIYKVAWDEGGLKLGFATDPNPASKYNFNTFGTVHKTFDLLNRHIVRVPPVRLQSDFGGPGTLYRSGSRANGTNALTARLKTGRGYDYPGDQPGENPFRGLRGDPQSFGFLRRHAGTSLFSTPVVVGSDLGELQCLDLKGNGEITRRRHFIGHENLVTSISQSPSLRMIASSSTDGTIRIWSLDNFKEYGDIDFQVRGTQVLNVNPGSLAAVAGIRDSDEIVQFDGMRFYDSRRRILDGDYQAGQTVNVQVRDRSIEGAPARNVRLRLASVADSVEPLLTVFVARDGEWITWTPDGFYDASAHADRYLGFHVNQGRDKAALWITARQFEKQLYRPDIIDQVLSTGERFGGDAPARPNENLDVPQQNLTKFRPPEVRLLSPNDGEIVHGVEATVTAEIFATTSLPVTNVKLTVNGFPVPVDDVIDGHSAQRMRQDVRLQPGDNAITLTAMNREAKSVETTISVKYEVPVREFTSEGSRVRTPDDARTLPSLHVLAVGVSDYEDSGINLQFAHKDAEDFAAVWKQQEGRQYGKVTTTVLQNSDATKQNVLAKVDELLDAVEAGDRVAVFFSAHGATDARDKYYLLTHDVDTESLRSTAIPHSDIEAAIDDLLVARCQVMLFVDTCHSGGAVGAKGLPKGNRLRQTKRDYWRSIGSVAFMSSLPGQESYERPEWENGAFTEAFVEAMGFNAGADANKDNHLSITELQLYLENRVQELTNSRQSPSMQRQPDTPGFDIAVGG